MTQTATDHISVVVPVGQRLPEAQDIDVMVHRPGDTPLSVTVRLVPESGPREPEMSTLPARTWKPKDDVFPEIEYGGGD